MILGAPPWADSGYGIQARETAYALQRLGHTVAVAAFAGCHARQVWNGIEILPVGQKPFGNGLIAGTARRWKADLVITLCDPWTLQPDQFAGIPVMPWMPVDCEPLSVLEARFLARLQQITKVWPVAMSEFGQRMLVAAGFKAPVVPHCVPDGFAAAADPDMFRAEVKVPAGAFLVVKVGVNNSDDRKAFVETLLAFARWGQKDAVLYLHTEAQAKDAPNLVLLAAQLGLRHRVAFPSPEKRAADLYPAPWMAGMYTAADVADVTSRSEGFGVPCIEALACGTPVIGCRNSATTEKICPEWGWLIGGQEMWARHHGARWMTPSVPELARAYEKAHAGAARKRAAAARAGEQWTVAAMTAAWEKALANL